MKFPNFDGLDTTLVFRHRPEPIPGDLRPLWRISIVLLILRLASRGEKSTLSRLHVLNWAIRTHENRQVFRGVVAGNVSPDTIIVRIEPSLNRAIDFARGEGLLKFVTGNRIRLTNKGKVAANEILAQMGLFNEEKVFLQEIGKSGFTEKAAESLFAEG